MAKKQDPCTPPAEPKSHATNETNFGFTAMTSISLFQKETKMALIQNVGAPNEASYQSTQNSPQTIKNCCLLVYTCPSSTRKTKPVCFILHQAEFNSQ